MSHKILWRDCPIRNPQKILIDQQVWYYCNYYAVKSSTLSLKTESSYRNRALLAYDHTITEFNKMWDKLINNQVNSDEQVIPLDKYNDLSKECNVYGNAIYDVVTTVNKIWFNYDRAYTVISKDRTGISPFFSYPVTHTTNPDKVGIFVAPNKYYEETQYKAWMKQIKEIEKEHLGLTRMQRIAKSMVLNTRSTK